LPRGGPYVFERLDGLPILRRVTRAGADVGEAELVQDLAHRALVVGDAEALGDEVLQVDSAPAHDPMHRPIRAGLDEARQVCLLIGRQARWAACPPPILKPVRPAVVEAVNPIAQRLPVHAPDPGRLRPVHPVQNRGQ